MRTDNPRPRAASSTRLRDGAGRAWRRVAGLDFRLRLAAVAGLAALVVLAYYAANQSTETTATAWLFDGPGLPAEDARRTLAALSVAKIPATTGPRGQIAVPASRKGEALAVLAKQKLLPKTLDGVRAESEHASMFWPVDRNESRDDRRRQEAEIIIAGFDGVESAAVLVQRATRVAGQRAAKVAAVVWVQPRDGRPLPAQTLQAIESLLKSMEPDLPADGLTILDKSGRRYLVAGDPEAGAAMKAQVREEELRGKILAEFDRWIDGIRVLVSVDAAPSTPQNRAPAAPAVVVNGPVEIEPAPAEPVAAGKARILVQVPNNHYLYAYYNTHHREATREELNVYVPQVNETIRTTIQNVVPVAEIASLRVDRFDVVGPIPPPVAAASPRAIVLPQWLIPAAAGAAVAMVALVLVGTRWMIAARRPVAAAPAEIPRPHLAFDSVDTGPSGRVRDLVRRDPAAAAGVLGRWIGQGGSAS